MYMEDSNLCIKNEIISFIEIYKKHDISQQHIALKIEALVKNIVCFFCLDQKQCWNYRGHEYKGDKKGEFFRQICPHCLTMPIENLWIEDCISTDLVGPLGIKLFRHDAQAGSEKFKALENDVIQKHPEIGKPEYTKISVDSIHKKEKTYKLELELGKIIDTCKQALESYTGNISSTINLIKNIKLNISCFDEKSNKNKLLCEEIKPNQFVYIVIKNHSTQKKKSRLGIYNYQKFYLDIQIDIFEIKTLNDSAHHLCNKIINDSADKNINEIIKLFK